ncbi:MAG: hypothetical protein ACI91O_000207 [Candidatus Poriferisodalaceae bacterium]|jgi:uncharacterized protein (DUF1800 family)
MDRNDAIHLVRRTGFGIDWALVDQIEPLSRSAAVDLITDFSPNAPAVAPAGISDEGGTRWRQINELQIWWLERMRSAPRPLQEKLVLFWHGHFATSAYTVAFAHQVWNDNQMLRAHSLGSFRDMAQGSALSPAMLLYLDNYRNKATRLNENYGRELLELHLLGPGEHHSEFDVVETSRAWTGYNTDFDRRAFVYNAQHHDEGQKTIFGITRNWSGPEVIDEAVFNTHRITSARYIAAKLWSFLAYPNPSSDVVDSIVQPYLDNNLSLASMTRAVLLHDKFYSAEARNGLVRSPIEWAVSCSRSLGVSAVVSRPEWTTAPMGQDVYYVPDPSGWKQNEVWITPTAAWARADFARNLGWKAISLGRVTDVTPMTVPDAVEHVRLVFGLDVLSNQTRKALEDYVHAERATGKWAQTINLMVLAMLSPEMQMA